MSDKQGDLAILGKLAHGVDQGIGARIVETISDFHPVRVELIAQLQQLECLPGAGSAGAKDGIDGNREHGRHRKLASRLSNGGRRRVLSDARELASGQQLDANVYLVGPDGGVSIARELSGNGASICLSRVCTGFRYSGWLFESTQLDPCAHALAVGGLGPFDCDPRRWPDPAIENRHLLRRAHPHGCSNPPLPAVALAPRLADDLKKQLADRSVRI